MTLKLPKKDSRASAKRAPKLSRSKLDLFINCPRCFYLDRKFGIGRPPSLPFTLNSAVDTLLKNEFNVYRLAGKTHPLMEKYGIDAVPFRHKDLDTWRTNTKGATFFHKPTGMIITGSIDDVWVKPDGSLIIADYKATSTSKEITMESGYRAVFKRQLEIYQWIFRRMGFDVDPVAYLVYANALKSRGAFDAKLEFEMKILKVDADDRWVEDAIIRAQECLASGKIPDASNECTYCAYVGKVKKALP